jgi:hypothetical protein
MTFSWVNMVASLISRGTDSGNRTENACIVVLLFDSYRILPYRIVRFCITNMIYIGSN